MNKKYDIHPDFAKFPVVTLTFNAALLWLINTAMKAHCFFVRRSLKLMVDDHVIARADGSQLKIFTLTPHRSATAAPALIYYHGGGFGITYANLHLKSCERYANETGCVLVFVPYRLAPKHPFPGGFDDCYAGLEWVASNAESLGIDANRIAVGGDSAGGALAAGVAQKSRDDKLVKLCAQLLIYPVLDNTCSTPSATEFTDVPVWNARSNRHMWDMYLSRYKDATTPTYAAPGHSELHHLPMTYIETAEFDPLRDEGLRYVAALRGQGIEVTVNETKQTVHGYDAMERSEISKRSMLARIAFLNHAFSASDNDIAT
ncbi:MAG: alpha/beta hydrolase [Halioglobus sp.]|nr:alpha/beta hydrolase [Halioglobus sp.]